MKAAVCYEFGEPLVVEEIEIDWPQEGEVKVKVDACAVCHSDVHLVKGEWGGTTPVVAGHEAAGTVSEVGERVADVQPGDRVVVSLLRACGHCFFCTIGRPFNCEGDFSLNHGTRLHRKDGTPIAQGINMGAFAEEVIVDQSQVVPIPEEVPMDHACLLACGVITGFGAVTNTGRVEPGSAVAVIGIGGVGLNSVQGAAISGAATIVAVDLLDSKLEAAGLFGATHTVHAGCADPVEEVLNLTQGRGVDYAFATVGNSKVIAQATQMTRIGGTAVIVGMPPNEDVHCALNAHHLTWGRTIKGSFMGGTRLSVDIPRLVLLYLQGRLRLKELITERYSLTQINEAVDVVQRGEALRNVILL